MAEFPGGSHQELLKVSIGKALTLGGIIGEIATEISGHIPCGVHV